MKMWTRWAATPLLALAVATLAFGAEPVDPATVLNARQAAEWAKSHKSVSFELLSEFEYPMEALWTGVPVEVTPPANLRALDGQKVQLTGYVIPLDYDGKSMGSFIVVPTIDMCHFGALTVPNQWVMVTMKNRTEFHGSWYPITVFGTLEVGQKIEDGFFESFYRMNGAAVHTVTFY